MTTSYFANIPPVRFEGADSVNPLAYRYYDKDRRRSRQADGRPSSHGSLLLAHVLFGGRGHVRPGDFRPSLE